MLCSQVNLCFAVIKYNTVKVCTKAVACIISTENYNAVLSVWSSISRFVCTVPDNFLLCTAPGIFLNALTLSIANICIPEFFCCRVRKFDCNVILITVVIRREICPWSFPFQRREFCIKLKAVCSGSGSRTVGSSYRKLSCIRTVITACIVIVVSVPYKVCRKLFVLLL